MLAVIFAFLFGQLPNPVDYSYGITAFNFHCHYLNLDPFYTLLGLVHWSLLLVRIFGIIFLEWDLIGLLLCIDFFGLLNENDFNLVFKVFYKLIGTYLFSLFFHFILFLFYGYPPLLCWAALLDHSSRSLFAQYPYSSGIRHSHLLF